MAFVISLYLSIEGLREIQALVTSRCNVLSVMDGDGQQKGKTMNTSGHRKILAGGSGEKPASFAERRMSLTAQTNLPLTLIEELDAIFEDLVDDLYAEFSINGSVRYARERILRLISERTNLVQ